MDIPNENFDPLFTMGILASEDSKRANPGPFHFENTEHFGEMHMGMSSRKTKKSNTTILFAISFALAFSLLYVTRPKFVTNEKDGEIIIDKAKLLLYSVLLSFVIAGFMCYF